MTTTPPLKALIEVYHSPLCPYCVRARRTLDHLGAQYKDYNVLFQPALRHEMVARSHGRTTVPQIFINDKHIGGNDDMQRLLADGRLLALLQEQPQDTHHDT